MAKMEDVKAHLASAEETSTPTSTETEKLRTVVPVDTPAHTKEETPARSQDELLALLVQLQSEKAQLEEANSELSTRVTDFESAKKKEEEERLRVQKEKLSGISSDLLEWCSSNGFELTDERVEKLQTLANKEPANASILFEIAHCASKKHVEAQGKLQEQKKLTKTQTLQAKVENIIKQRQNAAGPVGQTTTHVASVESKTEENIYAAPAKTLEPRFVRNGTPPESLIQAIKRQRTSYTGRSAATSLYNDLRK